MIRTVPNIVQHYGCSQETAQRYIDLRDEGYPQHQALLMAGLSDPPEEFTSGQAISVSNQSGFR